MCGRSLRPRQLRAFVLRASLINRKQINPLGEGNTGRTVRLDWLGIPTVDRVGRVPRRTLWRGMTSAMSTAFSGAIVAEAEVLNLVPPSRVGTGICFLDHMIDQLTSHGQVGVTLRCGVVHASPEVTSSSNKRAAPCSPTS